MAWRLDGNNAEKVVQQADDTGVARGRSCARCCI